VIIGKRGEMKMACTKSTVLANSKNHGGTRSASSIKYLVYHYTGNETDKALSNANYFKNNVVKASAHYFVDDTSIVQSVPDLTIAWAVGGNKYSDCATTGGGTMYGIVTNSNSISIEMCSTNGAITEKTMENAATLGKELMEKYNIPVSNIYRHFDVTGKKCVGWAGWYGKSSPKWDAFKKRLSDTTTYTKKQFIKDVQTALGLTSDGKATTTLLNKTITVSRTINNKHDIVKPIQTYLNLLGYSCGEVDGSFGAKTEESLKLYQSKVVGLKSPDGVITKGKGTWKKLLGLS
jgi:N-acetylmuramoyl-L-alanine amidase CwlA